MVDIAAVPIFKRAQSFAKEALRYAPTWPAVYAVPPTLALSGPGGSSPINSGSPTKIPYTGQPVGYATNAASASGNVLNFASTTNVIVGMPVTHGVATSAIPAGTTVLSKTSTTVTLSSSVTGSGVASGDLVAFGISVVSFLGIVPVYKTQFGVSYYTNGCNASWTPEVYAVEFDCFSPDIAIRFRAVSSTANFWVWVDGQPVSSAPSNTTGLSNGSLYWYRITFNNAGDSTARMRRVRVYMNLADFGGIDISPTDTVSPVQQVYPKLAIYGDSWAEGALGAIPGQQTIGAVAAQVLGTVPFICGQGGTGYTTNGGGGGKAAYTDAGRLSALAQTSADIVLMIGSINDNASSPSAVQTATAASISSVQASLPNAKIIVAGVQPTPTALASSTYAALNAAVAAAAVAANVPFVDMLNNDWITGTGYAGNTNGSGNSDIMIGTDANHPVPGNGTDYFGRRIAGVVAAAA